MVMKLMTPFILAASSMSKLIVVFLYIITEWLDWMKAVPPISAARLNTRSTPLVTFTVIHHAEVNKMEFMTEHILHHMLILVPVRGNNIVSLTLQSPGNVWGNKSPNPSNRNPEFPGRPVGFSFKFIIGAFSIWCSHSAACKFIKYN